MAMFHPPPPGEILREDIIEAAPHLRLTRVQLSRILNERAGISPDLAVRLERAGISTARQWMALQSAHELWQAEHREQPAVKRLVPAA